MKIDVYSPTIKRKEMDAVLTAMVEEKIGPGDRNRILIQTAKEQIPFDYAIALRSSAVALQLALKAVISANTEQEQAEGIPRKKAVIISALSPRYYLDVIMDMHLIPLFCDVSFDLPCMNRQTIENVITGKPDELEISAIILHHTLGFFPDSASIAELGFPVIEDISQSYGSWIGTEVSETAEGSTPDKYPDKNPDKNQKTPEKNFFVNFKGSYYILGLEERDMLTSGGGALLFAMNRREGTILRSFSGIPDEFCLPDINAALAVVQFKEFHRSIKKRKEIVNVYTQASMRTRHKRFIPFSDNEFNYYSFSLVLETGLKDVISYARKKDIIIESAFEKNITGVGPNGSCPASKSLALRTVLFPLYPRLGSSEIERVSRLIMTLP